MIREKETFAEKAESNDYSPGFLYVSVPPYFEPLWSCTIGSHKNINVHKSSKNQHVPLIIMCCGTMDTDTQAKLGGVHNANGWPPLNKTGQWDTSTSTRRMEICWWTQQTQADKNCHNGWQTVWSGENLYTRLRKRPSGLNEETQLSRTRTTHVSKRVNEANVTQGARCPRGQWHELTTLQQPPPPPPPMQHPLLQLSRAQPPPQTTTPTFPRWDHPHCWTSHGLDESTPLFFEGTP